MTKNHNLWLSCIDQYYSAKNAFQAEVKSGIKEYDRYLISDPEYYRTSLENWIRGIHEKHKRCGEITIDSGYHATNSKDIAWRIGSNRQWIVRMRLLRVEQWALKTELLKDTAPEIPALVFDKPAIITSNADWNDEHLDADPYA